MSQANSCPAPPMPKSREYAPLREPSIFRRYFNMTLPVLVGAQMLALPGIFVGLRMIAQRRQWLAVGACDLGRRASDGFCGAAPGQLSAWPLRDARPSTAV